jgi:hypothetical protein
MIEYMHVKILIYPVRGSPTRFSHPHQPFDKNNATVRGSKNHFWEVDGVISLIQEPSASYKIIIPIDFGTLIFSQNVDMKPLLPPMKIIIHFGRQKAAEQLSKLLN